LGLTNVTFVAADISTWVPDAHGPFDDILCHGVFSWVSEAVQDAILGRLRDVLTPARNAIPTVRCSSGSWTPWTGRGGREGELPGVPLLAVSLPATSLPGQPSVDESA